MKSRKAIIVVSILLVLTGIFAFLHLSSRDETLENSLSIVYNGETHFVNIDKLEYTQVSGSRFNGKGEEIKVEGLAIALKDVLSEVKAVHYSKVTLEANDAYKASVSYDEVNEYNKVYLLKDENTLRLVVFGDNNSKRSVSDIIKIQVD